MKCDKLFKEAFEGIEFRYKLDDTLEGLGTQKFTANQLEGYLLGKGVSPKEIKQSSIFDGMIDGNRALPADMWLAKSGSQEIRPYIDKDYSAITLGEKGRDNESYKVTLSGVKAPSTNVPSEPHFSDTLPNLPLKEETMSIDLLNSYIDQQESIGRKFIDYKNDQEYKDLYSKMRLIQETMDEPKQSLLGWRRTHIDEINGKKTLVLNEFQSDWAQTERAGRGIFESTKALDEEFIKQANELGNKHFNNYFEGKPQEYIDEYHSEWMEQFSKEYPKESGIVFGGGAPDRNLVADFPMSEVKHHQFQIVGAINDAIKEGIDTVAIPIQRENELAGSKGVTKFYESLNTKILPDIRKKLEKQGLKIKVDKKQYTGGTIDYSESFNRFINTELTKEERMDLGYLQDLATNHLETRGVENETIFEAIESANTIDELLKALQPTSTNDLWTLTIEEVPNGKVKWDVYSILTALGLGSYATQSEANTKISKEPSMEGKFDLAKRVGSKLNYNEYDTEVADYFANIESGGDYNARNKGSSAFGKYQVIRSTLVEKAKDLGISVKEARTPEGQEMVMHSLLSDYKARLKEFNLPITKENMFVLHNLGQTGGVRVLRGTYTGDDIKAMRANVSSEERKLPNDKLVKAYTERYNINIPPKQES